MPKLRRLTGREVLALLQRVGFEIVRSRGSHFTLKLGECSVTVPVHGNDSIAIGTLRQIYKDALACASEEEISPLFYTK
jgi:predicted RNA binding protein YcfA (HicA-like mRNA interferase family)